jgi:hypothetical protein
MAERAVADSNRVLASSAVLRVTGAVLAHLHARFARAVYGRRYFHAIASDMPGPREPLTGRCTDRRSVPDPAAGAGSPLAVGALGGAIVNISASRPADPSRTPPR